MVCCDYCKDELDRKGYLIYAEHYHGDSDMCEYCECDNFRQKDLWRVWTELDELDWRG